MAAHLVTNRASALAWSIVDQSASSATTFVFLLVSGKRLGPGGLGIVAIGFSAYLLTASLQRAFVAEPLIVESAGLDDVRRRAATGHALSANLGITAATIVVALLVIALVGGRGGRGLLLFVPWAPAVLVQDLWRTVLFRDRRGRDAATASLLWLSVTGVWLIAAGPDADRATLVAGWGTGGVVAATFGLIRYPVAPTRFADAWGWWSRRAWPLGRWLGLQEASYAVGIHGAFLLLAALADPSDLGGLRAVQTLFAPLTLLTPAVNRVGLPLMAEKVQARAPRTMHIARRFSAFTTIACAAYLLVLAPFGGSVLAFFFGRSFEEFSRLIIPIATGQIFAALSIGFFLLLKARGRGRVLAGATAAGATVTLILVAILEGTAGIKGAAWGFAAAPAVAGAITATYAVREFNKGHVGT